MSDRQYNLQRDPADERDYKLSAIVKPVSYAKLPKKVDLRSKCPAVFNQGSLGSCTAQAGSAARIMLEGNPSLDLSELYLYYMERVLEGTVDKDNGATMRSICKALNKYGICEEKYMPYIPQNFRVPPSAQAHENAANRKITAYRSLYGIKQVKECLAFRQQPVMIGMEVYESFEQMSKDGKLKIPKPGEACLGGHAVLVVGYVDNTFPCLSSSKGYFIVRNSWGSQWGDKGYFYMPYEFVSQGYAWDFWTLE